MLYWNFQPSVSLSNNAPSADKHKRCSTNTTQLQLNRTNAPVHTETEQYTYIQSQAPEDECNSIQNMLSNKKLS